MDELTIKQHYFASGATLSRGARISALKALGRSIEQNRQQIYDALWNDLHKCEAEALLTEVNVVMSEIDNQLRHLRARMRPHCVPTPWILWPSRSRVECQPLGTVLVIAPWNYPFNLALTPLVGAIAAGNCAVVKPSDYTPRVSAVIAKIVAESLAPEHVSVVEGGRDVNTALLAERWDYIFFTGGPALGRVVMQAAARDLTPVTLELGGKSPCIVDRTANIDLAARRIVWGKFLNAGQTCVAPDHLFVHCDVKEQLVERMRHYITEFYGSDPHQSPHYGRIVNVAAFERLSELIGSAGRVVIGGSSVADERYIAPTVIDGIAADDPIMQHEIFGPLLPVLDFTDINEVTAQINSREKPLALYYFGSSQSARWVLDRTSSGGACVNDLILHIANDHLPFGGVGGSGMGRYHGRDSFLTFSNRRAVLTSPRSLDLPFRYPPFRFFNIIKRII